MHFICVILIYPYRDSLYLKLISQFKVILMMFLLFAFFPVTKAGKGVILVKISDSFSLLLS